jgi:CxxC motif-containing protein
MEIRTLTCIGCPMGCQIEVGMDGEVICSVSGNSCMKGDIYARKEVTNPKRIVTTTVRVEGSVSGAQTVSCKTRSDVPKGKIFDCVRDVAAVSVHAPVHIGDVVKANIAGTGVDMIATKDVP